MIKELIKIGKEINESKLKLGSFSELCFEHLCKFQNNLNLDDFENELSEWMLKGELPEQLNVHDGFGQPPITIFNNGEFVVDLYFWMNIDTSIHSHAFSGAFKVLYGRSIHEEFLIKPKVKISEDIMITEFKNTSIEILKRNDCREIVKGNLFNHRLVHLDTPTITLCIRTINDTESSQWHHFSNGLSVEKKDLSANILKRLYYYNYLFKTDQQKSFNYISKQIEAWDKSTLLNIYEKLSMGSIDLDEGAIEIFTEVFLNGFGESEWFKLYDNFFSELEQSYIELDGDSPEIRALEHALTFRYPKIKATKLVEEIQGSKLSKEQSELLSKL